MTLATIRNNLFRFCPGLNPDIVTSTIQDSYRQLGMMEWNRLNVTRQISTIAPYSTGTVTITTGGTVTGVGTSFTAGMVGRQFRAYYQDSFFEILTVTPSTTLTLRAWPGNVVSSAIPYSIFQTTYSVDSVMKIIFDVVYQTSLTKKSQDFFNRLDPERSTTGSPVWFAYAGFNPLGYPLLEIYPVPSQVYPLRIYGKLGIAALGESDTPYLPEDLIEAHALLSCFRIKEINDPKGGWEQRITGQAEILKGILGLARDEDYILGAHRDKVKDYMSTYEEYPPSDTFWASHDVE